MFSKREFIKRFSIKNRLLTLYLSLGIIGVCMLVFSAWTPGLVKASNDVSPNSISSSDQNSLNPENGPTSSGEQNTALTTPSTTPTARPTSTAAFTATPIPTATSSPTPTPNPLMVNANPEINELVQSYYKAKLTGELSSFEPLVSDLSTIDIDYLHIQYELIKNFSNFTCYTKNGINEIAYIVYVSYDSEIVTIDTPAPSLDRLTLVYANDGSGRLLINTSADKLSDEVTAYCEEVFTHADVQEMLQRESERFDAAVASDPSLQELQNRLNSD